MKKRFSFLPLFVFLFIVSCTLEESNNLNLSEAVTSELPLLESTTESSTSNLSTSLYAPSGYVKVWEDQFEESSINTDNWTVASLRDPISGDLVPGAKGDHLLNNDYAGYITPEDSYIENGALVLRNQKRAYSGTNPSGSYNYTSGWVMSMHKVFLNKGYIEMRAQFPSGDKVWPAMWMVAEDLIWGPEWDMFEYFGYRSDVGYDVMGMHLAYDAWPNVKWKSDWIPYYDFDFDCEAWHVYGFEWTENEAIWTIDGNIVRVLYSSYVSNWPDEDMYLIFNNGVKTSSPDSNTTWPNYLKIDYVEIYKKDATPPVTNELYVSNIRFRKIYKNNLYYVKAQVYVKDSNGEIVPGALVDVDWSGSVSGSSSKTTNSKGKAHIISPKLTDGGTFTVTVNNITLDGYTYNPALNIVSTKSVVYP